VVGPGVTEAAKDAEGGAAPAIRIQGGDAARPLLKKTVVLWAERDQCAEVGVVDVAVSLDVVDVEATFPRSADSAEVVPCRKEPVPL